MGTEDVFELGSWYLECGGPLQGQREGSAFNKCESTTQFIREMVCNFTVVAVWDLKVTEVNDEATWSD